MISSIRYQKILNLLKEDQVIVSRELASALGISLSTIQRDLKALEQQNLLKRTHGGAVLVNKEDFEPKYMDRTNKLAAEKMAIAKVASEFVNPGDVIALDAGTTISSMLPYISKMEPLTIITAAINIATQLKDSENITVVLAGGIFRPNTYSVVGDLAERNLAEFKANRVFTSCSVFSMEKGTMAYNLSSIGVKRTLSTIAKETIVLADHSKFEGNAFAQVVPIEKITTFITDWGTPSEYIEQLRKKGINVIVAQDPRD